MLRLELPSDVNDQLLSWPLAPLPLPLPLSLSLLLALLWALLLSRLSIPMTMVNIPTKRMAYCHGDTILSLATGKGARVADHGPATSPEAEAPLQGGKAPPQGQYHRLRMKSPS